MVLSHTPRSALFPTSVSQHSRVRLGAIEISQISHLPGLASVEAYSYKTNEWFFVAPMNTRRSSVGVGVVEGKEQQRVWPGLGLPILWLYSFHYCSESGTGILT